MKGKGGPSGGKKASSSDDEATCPLQSSEFEVIDIEKICPRFFAVTNRAEDESVGLEDLDVLQHELETMLVSVSRRQIAIQSDIEALNSWNESSRPQGSSLKLKVSTPIKSESGTRSELRRSELENKRKSRLDDVVDSPRMTKKVKSECISSPLGSSASSISSCSSSAIAVASGSKFKSKSKNLSMKIQPTSTVTTQYHEPVASQVPDKFYAFIEPYCAPIKPEHVEVLEEMLANYNDDALDEYLKVPNLGKHYTLKWSLNDNVVGNGSVSPMSGKATPKGKKKKMKTDPDDPSNDSFETPEAPSPAKKGKKKAESTFGPFTQRLLQALLEMPSEFGDVMTSLENTDDEATEDNSSRPSSPAKSVSSKKDGGKGSDVKPLGKNPLKTGNKKVTKALNLGNTSQLEKRIKKELEDAGLLELDDGSSLVDDEDDEILRELIQAQNELKMVSEQNKSQLEMLLSKAKLDMARQEIQEKLKVVDEEVIETYRKITALKSKKKSPSKKERDAAIKALKERDELIQQLDSLSC